MRLKVNENQVDGYCSLCENSERLRRMYVIKLKRDVGYLHRLNMVINASENCLCFQYQVSTEGVLQSPSEGVNH
jgi:hypothetical protein